ncbi:MAG: double-strand break repair protein AddB [Alphaproteobacteria bacterium]|nr:double-strand break repair protein AddB [Alphaproteobacteria bacterium]
MKGIFTIGADRRFVDELARVVLAQYGGDPLTLADVRILLPTRRAVRALREAFLRAGEGRPTLLPRLSPLGDLDDSEWERVAGDIGSLDLLPALEPAEREAMLARLVAAFHDEGQPVAQSAAQALKLARELAHLLDELTIEGVSFERLEDLVEESFASHWQRTLRFLRIIGEEWPKILAERGMIDAIDRRSRLLRARAERWRNEPPATPVIAAGSTGSQPPTRELLSVIAGLPQGMVVLAGLDRDMDDASWQALDASHPQFGLRQLLEALGCERRNVQDWPGTPSSSARHFLISELMRPAETSEAWATPPLSSLDHVTRVDCATPHQEAVAIALALREALEQEGRTAALVTPDRALARRVAAELKRWNVEIDDSAGMPLADTPPATLMRALIDAVAQGFAPVALLALLKHPLCTLRGERAAVLAATRRLDRRCLRGLKPDFGLDSIRARIADARLADPRARLELNALIDRLETATAPLTSTVAAEATVASLLEATLAAAESVANAEALWSGDAGEALADALARLRSAWTDRAAVAPAEWPALFVAMLEPETVRPAYGRHPRLAIWGPLEARLQHADLLVLGGLNEGTWPPAVETGPWVNRPMRAALGLPQPERGIGLSAHDFAMALGAEAVLLTRAEREGTSPTVPSRWLARLDALFGYEGVDQIPPQYIQRGRRSFLAWAARLDRPEAYRPWPRPEPVPPLEARPTKLPVSGVEQWRRDPYGLYARRILDLRLLDPLEAAFSAADRGVALHKTLDEFVQRHPSGLLPPGAAAEFEQLGAHHLRTLLTSPAERAFWWPRFQRLARWLIALENGRRGGGARLLGSETDGALVIGPRERPLRIEARADRIDDSGDGTWDIIDYKTGRVPSKDELEALFAPQLLLEAAMAERAGFTGIEGRPAAVRPAYWQANGLGDGGKITTIDGSEELTLRMLEQVERMAARFAQPSTGYPAVPWPRYIPAFNDYAHLARIAEWSTAGGGEE